MHPASFLRHTYPALLWALFILSLCALPGKAIPHLTFLDWLRPDKVVHLVLFGVLSYLLIRGLTRQQASELLRSNAVLTAVTFSVIYGIFIEWLQEYAITDRTGEVFDAVADAAGAFTGWWFYSRQAKAKSSKA